MNELLSFLWQAYCFPTNDSLIPKELPRGRTVHFQDMESYIGIIQNTCSQIISKVHQNNYN